VSVRQRIGTPISVGEGEHPNIDGYDGGHGLYPNQLDRLRRADAGALATRISERPPSPFEIDVPFEAPDRWLADDETIPVTGGVLAVIATPGHTRGHIVLRHAPSGVVFTGDHVLPLITPAIGHEYDPPVSPLRDYLSSLERMRRIDDGTMAPAHGGMGGDVAARATELLAHHEARLREIAEYVLSGQQTAFAIADAKRWTSHGLALYQLDVIHQMTAILEVDAHLDVLRERGLVELLASDGSRRFGPAR